MADLNLEKVNNTFVFAQIRKYNQASRQIYKDRALLAIGVHVGLISRFKAIAPGLSDEERRRILYFIDRFLTSQEIAIELKGGLLHVSIT